MNIIDYLQEKYKKLKIHISIEKDIYTIQIGFAIRKSGIIKEFKYKWNNNLNEIQNYNEIEELIDDNILMIFKKENARKKISNRLVIYKESEK